ncbi:MAG: phosphoribosylformylglycinamidine synthase subunit PurL [Chloroflexota bacterium]|nr:phosphoribosylformylglycinamidine synthase subunit PurL [Chloroflexota bacterium]
MTTGTVAPDPTFESDLPREVGLTPFEAERVRALVGREPNAVEWGMFGAMWSEHCGYKHSKKLLRTLPTKGARVALGPGENAGAVDLGGGLLCVFKAESHNHPSAVEPYQGAATGVGGILRDIFAMGARPVALLNALAFGPPDEQWTRRLVAGVVGGISFYGNCVGIPDVGGHVSFEDTYRDDPLVNAMCIGLVRREGLRLAGTARPGSAVYLVGSDTGRDGIAGASLLASFELGSGDDAKRPSVQVGDPFLEKLLLEATLELVERDAVEAIQDLGAAGLTCAASEVAAKSAVGMRLDVDLVPRRAGGMTPYEVMLSESQERMLVVARPGRERDVEETFRRWGLHGTRIGVVTEEQEMEVVSGGETVVSLAPRWLVDDVPEYDVTSWAQAPSKGGSAPRDDPPRSPINDRPDGAEPEHRKVGLELLELLASPRVASRRILYRTYDQMVGTDTVVGPGGDAAVLRIKGRRDGIATSIDAQPRLAAADPFVGAAAAVAEATRNVVCAGARPLAITDCLNLGNPERPEGAWQLERTVAGIVAACETLGVPVVSGNVSLYNATRGPLGGSKDIWPTAVIGAVGHLDDVAAHIPVTTGEDGDVVLLAGSASVSLEPVAAIDLELEARLQRFVLEAHARGLVRAAHDRSDGGLAVALAELCLRRGRGVRAALPAVRGIDKRVALFGEGPSGIVLVAAPENADALRALAKERDVPLWTLGQVGGDLLEVAPLLGLPVASLRDAYENGLPVALGRAL